MVIMQYADIVLKGLIVLLALGAAVKFFLNGKKKSGKLRYGLQHLKTRAVAILVCAALFFGMFCGSQYLVNSSLPKLNVKFNYEEAAEGLNPNQTRFNESKLISEDILEKVIAKAGFDITPAELASCLELSSVFDSKGVNQTQLNISTEYTVICNDKLLATGIDGHVLLNTLAEVFTEAFVEEYAENTSILDLSLEEIDQIDYLDMEDYFYMNAEHLNYYLTTYNLEAPAFRSETTGETFASLSEKIRNFQNVELERYHAFALENGLSKNDAPYTMRIAYSNMLLDQEYQKEMAAYNVRLEAIDLYDEQMARIVLVPSTDSQLQYYMSRTKIGVDYFANEADHALEKATELQETIQNNKYASAQVEAIEARAAKAAADQMIEALKVELLSLAQQTKDLIDDYIDTTRNGYVSTSIKEPSAKSLMAVKDGAILSLLFAAAMASYVAASHMEARPGKKERTKSVV
ncbi:MAG: hypothetical protein IJN67_06470 [Oscillospiraceae bacterium]|nr:hypothetical protein [Oscillospiraceae bacterium]